MTIDLKIRSLCITHWPFPKLRYVDPNWWNVKQYMEIWQLRSKCNGPCKTNWIFASIWQETTFSKKVMDFSEHLKTFAKFKNIYPNFVYNKRTNYNLATFKNVEYKCVKSEVVHWRSNLKCVQKQQKVSGVRATTICGVLCAMKFIHLHLKLGRFQMPFLGLDCKSCCSWDALCNLSFCI
jgi:hypothetical protein